jgi:hypothetical protein
VVGEIERSGDYRPPPGARWTYDAGVAEPDQDLAQGHARHRELGPEGVAHVVVPPELTNTPPACTPP